MRPTVLWNLPDFSSRWNVRFCERSVHAESTLPIAWLEEIKAVERGHDYFAVRSSQFEIVAFSYSLPINYFKRHRRSEVNRPVLELGNLILWRRLERLRRCVNCQCWFLAWTAEQDCCSEKCRKKRRSWGPKFKAGRVKYMRDHRKRQKDRDVANLKASRRSR